MFSISALDPRQDRSKFTCGSAALDRYFRERVTQDIRRKVAACFVARDEQKHIAGFYTLSATSIALPDLPESINKRLPRYPLVPAARLGRLAVAITAQKQGLGGMLLADALLRCARAEIVAFALVVDAKNAAAAAFYQHHGFIAFDTQPLTLFLPL